MKEVIIIIACIALAVYFIRKARKLKNQPESKLSILEHPSTFEKPPIEMVSANPPKANHSKSKIINETENEQDSSNTYCY